MTDAPTLIEIPVPGLVVLVGAAGAGKSTLAARLFQSSEIISSDDLRAALSGNAGDQRRSRLAFGILHREVRGRLAAGRLVVVDATNVEPRARRELRRLAAAASVPAVAIAIIGSPADVHARNAARLGRVVPADIVDRHLRRLSGLGRNASEITAALLAEGFAAVQVIDAARAVGDRVLVRRVPGADPA